ncbi:MAG: IS5 family transposase [Acidobacteria bacterium]|nr:IS5 family transposase [Acidobacteriota bacterium]
MSRRKKVSGAVRRLEEIGKMVDWEGLAEIVSGLDRTRGRKGGRPPISFKVKLKMMFLQYTFNLSDEELEDQLIDRLSFQQFVGLGYDEEIPDLTTFWHFKEGLVRNALMDQVFESILGQIESRGLILKRGTIVDATIMPSGNRPLSNQKRKKLESEPSRQIDTDARSTAKGGKRYFGYKGHIGIDAGSKVIRKRTFTPAQVNDIREMHNLVSGDEQSVWGDKNYRKKSDKSAARALGIYYGVLDQRARGKQLSKRQLKRNKQKSRVRAAVEHPFAFMKGKLKAGVLRARNKARNSLRFDMWCIVYNVLRASYLLRRQTT